MVFFSAVGSFTKNKSCKLPHPPPLTVTALHVSLLVLPAQRSKATSLSVCVCVCVCVLILGSRGTELLSLLLPTMCNGSSSPSPSPLKTPKSTRSHKFSDHERILILQLFEFFDLLSQEQYPAGRIRKTVVSVCAWTDVRFTSSCPDDAVCFSPLLAQRRLDFTDSDQRAQVFELGAVLRQTDAPHGVSLLT